jgi:WD40 repeat protein
LDQSRTAQANASEANAQRATAVANGALAQGNAATAVARQTETDAQRLLAQNNGATAVANAQVAQANFQRAEAQRLADAANVLLGRESSNPLSIALLALRSLNTEYSPQGDAALTGAMSLSYPSWIFPDAGAGTTAFSREAGPWRGRYLLMSIYGDKTHRVRLWDVQTGQELRSLVGHTDSVYAMAFSPAGKYAATASADNTARLWDLASGQEVRRFVGHTGIVAGVAFSPDGQWVATSSADNTARLWDAATGRELRRFNGHTGLVSLVGFVGDGHRLITSSYDNSVRLWDTATGAQLQQIPFQSFSFWFPDGQIRYLVATTSALGARLWDLATGQAGIEVPGPINAVALAPDGKILLTGNTNGLVQMWDAHSGSLIRRFSGLRGAIRGVKLTPDGRTLAGGDWNGNIIVWDAASGDLVRRFGCGGGATVFPFSADGRWLLTGGGDICLWDLQARSPVPQFVGHTSGVEGVAFAPDGRSILTASADQTARLWNAATGQEIRRFPGHTGVVNAVAFTPDGRRALAASLDGSASLWDVTTGQELHHFTAQGPEYTVAVSSDGRYGAIGGNPLEIPIYDLHSGELVRTLQNSQSTGFGGIAFTPDGRYLVSTSFGEPNSWLWDLQTGQVVRKFAGAVAWLAVSPDGRRLVAASSEDNTVGLWDMATGQQVGRFTGHTSSITAVAYAHNGKWVLSGSEDRTARLWDVATGQELRRFQGHTGTLQSVTFSLDDRLVLTGSEDGTARLWYTNLEDNVSYLCGQLRRDFTDAERAQFEIKDTTPTCPAK